MLKKALKSLKNRTGTTSQPLPPQGLLSLPIFKYPHPFKCPRNALKCPQKTLKYANSTPYSHFINTSFKLKLHFSVPFLYLNFAQSKPTLIISFRNPLIYLPFGYIMTTDFPRHNLLATIVPQRSPIPLSVHFTHFTRSPAPCQPPHDLCLIFPTPNFQKTKNTSRKREGDPRQL